MLIMSSIGVSNPTNCFEKKKKVEKAIIQPSFQFYGIIYMVKSTPLCRGMARLAILKNNLIL